jgi:DNA-binding NarL/FixJ family response regulator
VLDLLAAGLTTAEIGLRLRVSSAAVRRHVSSAVRQTIASDRGCARS